jgi:hypothetical protein
MSELGGSTRSPFSPYLALLKIGPVHGGHARMELCANNPPEWVLGVTSNGPMAKGVCKEEKRKGKREKRKEEN